MEFHNKTNFSKKKWTNFKTLHLKFRWFDSSCVQRCFEHFFSCSTLCCWLSCVDKKRIIIFVRFANSMWVTCRNLFSIFIHFEHTEPQNYVSSKLHWPWVTGFKKRKRWKCENILGVIDQGFITVCIRSTSGYKRIVCCHRSQWMYKQTFLSIRDGKEKSRITALWGVSSMSKCWTEPDEMSPYMHFQVF